MNPSIRQQAEAITASANHINIPALYIQMPSANWRGVLFKCQKLVSGEASVSELKPASMLIEKLYNAIPAN
jgi:hypothetical protein